MTVPWKRAEYGTRNALRSSSLQKGDEMKKPTVALMVTSSQARLAPLLGCLKRLELEVLTVATCRQARQLLRTKAPVDVVFSDVTLADGNWSDVLRDVVDTGTRANVILNAPSPDAVLWSEALWRGVYDMLTEPHKEREVQQVVEGAVREAAARLPQREDAACALAG
jgi:DNA-binding NtrC family response regulator